jgi:REP element-mobilizing transposase RayT
MKNEFKTRKEIRMKNFDYSRNGLYFITICTKDRIPYLCTICDDSVYVGADIIRPIVNLTKTGNMTEYSMNQTIKHYDDVNVLKYCIMPDHIHIIISIMHDINTADCGRIISAPTIPKIIGSFKRYVSKNTGIKLWQKSYYDHIIRNEKEFLEICDYIDNNPLNWINNKFNLNKWR